MTAYDNDPRVSRPDELLFVVVADDRYHVCPKTTATEWWISLSIDSQSAREAHIRTEEDGDAWVRRTTRGPFSSADEAIRTLIGDPQ